MDVEDDAVYISPQTETVPPNYARDRSKLQYELTVRQEPKQARMCGIGGKADRRPIDPPVIVQLRVIDPSAPPSSDDDDKDRDTSDDEPPYGNLAGYAQSFLQNPYYFMFASLAKPDDDTELHWLKDGRTRCTTGSVVSSLIVRRRHNPRRMLGFFVFPDLSVRTEGSYRLKLSLYEVVGNDVRHCKSIYSSPFYVYTAKKFPGVEESSPLTCSLADQGIKIRIRKDIRMRKSRMPAGASAAAAGSNGPIVLPAASTSSTMPTVDPDPVDEDKTHRPNKRSRTDESNNNPGGGAPPVGTPWPSTPLIPPPPGAEIQGQPAVIPPPPPPMTAPPAPAQPPDLYDGRYAAYDQSAVAHGTPPVPHVMHPPPPPHAYPPQYGHPYYPYAHPPPPPPPSWGHPPGYPDPYQQQYGAPPIRYDYGHAHGYPPPPPPPQYPYYEQHPNPHQYPPAEYAPGTPPVTVPSNAPPVSASVGANTNANAAPGQVVVPSNAPPPMRPGTVHPGPAPHPHQQQHPMHQHQQYNAYRPAPGPGPGPYGVQPMSMSMPPYYYQHQPQPQHQHQHQHDPNAHTWGTPPLPNGYSVPVGMPPPPPVPVWGQGQAQAQEWHGPQHHGGPPGPQGQGQGQGRVELPPLRTGGQAQGQGQGPDSGNGNGNGDAPNANVNASAGSNAGKSPVMIARGKDTTGHGNGKKNPLSIGSIISDDREGS
ncbi:velvet factor-domain-containing protein [Mycena amicta]|nr:velvet factor-domain-containing protein [Mycena amicta]